MDSEVLTAAIGVIGTLVGTILGWALNNLSSMGKLCIYVCSWEDEFTSNHLGRTVASDSIEKTQYYSFKTSLDLYNSSGETKIMRDIRIVFTDGKNVLWSVTPDDQDTRRSFAHTIFCDEVTPINIPPKVVRKLNLQNGIWDKDGLHDFIWKSKRVYLQYINEKNHKVRILIKKENYAEYFANHKQEDSENGQAQAPNP